MSLLEVRDLTVRFGGLTAVDRVSFAVDEGRIVSVIGPNGAGKTTVFNAITALVAPSAGELRFAGGAIGRRWSWRDAARIALIAVVTALAVQVAYDVQALWRASVIDLYRYKQAFPWASSLRVALARLVGEGPWPALVGAALGAAAGWTVARAGRRTPDLVFRAGIARTFQNIRLFPELSCRENIAVAAASVRRRRFAGVSAALRLPPHRADERELRAVADELLRAVGLERDADAMAGQLPYGHQRRLEIARALAGRPRLLLLDEPAAGMNPSEGAELMRLIRAIRGRGVTVLLIEHHMHVVMGISDRVVVLDHGQKIAEGTPDEVRRDPAVIEAYLGKDEA